MKAFVIAVCLFCLAPAAGADWPERGLTLVTSAPRTLAWSGEAADPRAEALRLLVPRLSRELGVPVTLVFRPGGSGVLAGNMVSGAKPDGYLLGALGGDSIMGRVAQGFTPYVWKEFVPVALGWRTMYALVVPADHPAEDFRALALGLADSPDGPAPRLALRSITPIETHSLLALKAAQLAGFQWDLKVVETLDPTLLTQGEAEAMVLPLSVLNRHPGRDKFKPLLVFTRNSQAPCVRGLPTLMDQRLDMEPNPAFAFYLPSKANWRVRWRLSAAINAAFSQPGFVKVMEEGCLDPLREDGDGVLVVLNDEYQSLENLINTFNPMEAR